MRRRLPDILFWWFVIALVVPNVALSVTEPLGWWGRLANLLLPAGVELWLASLSRKFGRTVWLMFPLVFFAAFQTVLLWLYGRSVIAVDMFLNVVTTNPGEVGELLGNLWPAIILVCVLYLPPLIFSVREQTLGRLPGAAMLASARMAGVIMTLLGAVSLCGAYASERGYSALKSLYPVNVCYNIYLAAERTALTARYPHSSAGYTYDARYTRSDTLPQLTVLVIGETSRAADWQLMGYGRPTNPRLSRRGGLFTSRHALSESNTTHKSVPMLLSPVDATDFDTDIYKVKSLITAFREAGYATAFLSSQLPNRSFIEFFGCEADTTLFIKMQPGYRSEPGDFPLLACVDSVLASASDRQLIVLHTYGSHFDYRDRYPRDDARFLPDSYSEATASERPALVNAYDNTIVATDRFLDTLIGRLAERGGVSSLIYTSDHGEDIFDDGRHFLHASPVPSVMQVHVPLLVWLSDDFIHAYPSIGKALTHNMSLPVSTSRSYCPTALGLGGIESPRVDPEASLVSPSYKPRTYPLYLNDHNEAVALKSMLQ